MLQKIRKNKLLFVLIILSIIIFILGILFNTMIDTNTKKNITKNINKIILNTNKNPSLINFITCVVTNYLFIIIEWLLGISIIGCFITLFLYLYKVFILGFELISLIINLKFNKILIIILYLLPNVFNIIIYFIICLFSLSYSYLLFKIVFLKKEINLQLVMKKYIKILIIALILIFLSSIIEVFIMPKIISIL